MICPSFMAKSYTQDLITVISCFPCLFDTHFSLCFLKKKEGRKEGKERRERKGISHHGSAETNPTKNLEVVVLIPGLAQWVKDPALL